MTDYPIPKATSGEIIKNNQRKMNLVEPTESTPRHSKPNKKMEFL